MLKRIAAALFAMTAPAALLAEPVELRSADGFISVQGEIVGFNGTMLSVATSVGLVSVPAAEVICFGDGCMATINDNDFGLTESAFQAIAISEAVSPAPTPAPPPPVRDLQDNFAVSFDTPAIGTLYRTLAAAFTIGNLSSTNADLADDGRLNMQNAAGNETAVVTVAAPGGPSDLAVEAVSLSGESDLRFAGPANWATADRLTYQMLGLEAFAVLKNPNVQVDAITMEQLAGIYAGDITNWSELGGADQKILPLQLPVNAIQRNEIIKLVMNPFEKSIAGSVLTLADEASIVSSVSQFPGSISVVALDSVGDNVILPIAGSCGIPVRPDNFNIISGDYPLVRPVMASYDRTPNTTLLTELFDFAATEAAQELLAREGFISFNPITQTATEKNARLSQILGSDLDDAERAVAAQMFQTLFEANRLSPSFTGGAVSGPEGAWNRAMMLALAEELQDDAYAGREIMFVGLGTSTSGSQAAIEASAIAAAQTEAAFRSLASDVIAGNNLRLASFGFGEIAPATCYDGQIDSTTNTRVEIWLR